MNHAWPAPAKLNLFLHVVGRRPDGYHELQTVFQIVDLVDELQFTIREDPLIRRVAGPESLPAEDDLSVRRAGCRRPPAFVPAWILRSTSASRWVAGSAAAVPMPRRHSSH
jgi:hypothetical protein